MTKNDLPFNIANFPSNVQTAGNKSKYSYMFVWVFMVVIVPHSVLSCTVRALWKCVVKGAKWTKSLLLLLSVIGGVFFNLQWTCRPSLKICTDDLFLIKTEREGRALQLKDLAETALSYIQNKEALWSVESIMIPQEGTRACMQAKQAGGGLCFSPFKAILLLLRSIFC